MSATTGGMASDRDPLRAAGVGGPETRDLLAALLVGAGAILVFLPALGGDFLTFDDLQKLRYNPRIHGLGWSELRWMWTTTYTGLYQPLAWMTWGADYLVWGYDPVGYHLTSLLCHGATAALVYWLARRLYELAGPTSAEASPVALTLSAAIAGLLFAVHPLRAEPVVWISARGDVLATLFAVGATLAYLRAVDPATPRLRGRAWYAAALVFFACALLSKASAVALPLVWLVLDVYPLRRLGTAPVDWLGPIARRVWMEKAPFAIVAALVGLLAAVGKAQSDTMLPATDGRLITRIGQALYAVMFYVRTTLLPVAISPLYERPAHLDELRRAFLASALVAAAVTLGLIAARRRWPAPLAAWAAYLLLLAPSSGVFGYGSQLVAARYTYLSCIPLAILVGAVGLRLGTSPVAPRLGRSGRIAAAAAAAALVVGLGALSWAQAWVWRDSHTLWTYTLEVTPESAVAHVELGLLAERRGDFAAGADHFHQALARWPGARLQDVAIAAALEREGYHGAAAVHYRNALALAPQSRALNLALGRELVLAGQLDLATEHLTTVVARAPDFADARTLLGIVRLRRNEPDAAITDLRAAVRLAPDSAPPHYYLAAALRRTGHLEEADSELARAHALDPRLDTLPVTPEGTPSGRGAFSESGTGSTP